MHGKSHVMVFMSVVLSLGVMGSRKAGTLRDALAQTETQYDGSRQAGSQIGGIRVAGNRNISTDKILSRVRSRVGELLDPATAGEDAKRIATLPGVAKVGWDAPIVHNKVELTFVVVERDVVRSVDFAGNRKIKAKNLRHILGFKRGDWLDPMAAEAGRSRLTDFYRRKGFAFAQVALDTEKLGKGRLAYTINEGPRVKITTVKLSGNDTIKTGALRKAIKTQKRNWLLWPSYYAEDRMAEDVARLQTIYQKKGFLDAKITVGKKFSADKSKLGLTFEIDEGPVYTTERIGFTGNTHFDDSRLRQELKSKEGQIYSKRMGEADVKRLVKLYHEQGFIDTEVEHVSVLVRDVNVVNVGFEITEGQRFRIGRINIIGNAQTQDKVIRRVLDEYDFQPGQWYNADIARGDGSGYLEKLIRSTVLTEAATITPSGQTPGRKDAQVSVIEGQTGNLLVGAGLTSNSGVIGQLIWEQKNFDIKDWPESFGEFVTGEAFKGAGQNLRIALMPGTEVSHYYVRFTEPYLKDKPIAFDVVGSSWERWRESFDEQRTKGYVGLEKRYKNRWRRSVGFRVENVDVDGLDSDAPREIINVKGGNVLLGVKFGIGRDLTDDRFNPSRGYRLNAGYEQLGGDHTFGILSGTYTRHKTIYEDLAERKTILTTRLLAATVVGDAPPFEKFYAGGSPMDTVYCIRGFDYRGVSPRGLQTNVANPERKDPIGSDWIFLANAEAVVPLVGEEIAALFFVDSGAIDSGSYRAGLGTGIQIRIPWLMGPVPMRFEFATPLMKDSDDDTQVFSFSIGQLF